MAYNQQTSFQQQELAYVRYYPRYHDANINRAPAFPQEPMQLSLQGSKLFLILDRRPTQTIQNPLVLFVRPIPENDYFIVADSVGQIHVIDTTSNDLPYPQNTIYFNNEVD